MSGGGRGASGVAGSAPGEKPGCTHISEVLGKVWAPTKDVGGGRPQPGMTSLWRQKLIPL